MSLPAYSYRSDPTVPTFDDSQPLIIFDGLCVLYSTGVQWMLARDPRGKTRFAAVQDAVPQALYRHYNLDPTSFDTFMVLVDGVPYTRWAGVVAAGRTLPGAWRLLATVASLMPTRIGDGLYDWVQRNRISWFGNRQSCLIPSAVHRKRFLTA